MTSLLTACSMFAGACSGNASSESDRTSTTAPASPPATTTSLPPTRAFIVENVALEPGERLTVALHPTQAPIGVKVVANTAVEICSAGLDGTLGNSWPKGKFATCLAPDADGHVTLPSTRTDAAHVAFAARAMSGGSISSMAVSYTHLDAFLEVIPPMGRGDEMVVRLTPGYSSVGAQTYLVPGYAPTSGIGLEVQQGDVAQTMVGQCGFPSELTTCYTGLTPRESVIVTVHGNPPPLLTMALYLDWGR
jgi:hypothetical protein